MALRKTYSSPKSDMRMREMMDVFKQFHINLPLPDAIKQVPSYAKFLKNLCTQKSKNRTTQPNKVHLNEQVSSIITGQFLRLKTLVPQLLVV